MQTFLLAYASLPTWLAKEAMLVVMFMVKAVYNSLKPEHFESKLSLQFYTQHKTVFNTITSHITIIC